MPLPLSFSLFHWVGIWILRSVPLTSFFTLSILGSAIKCYQCQSKNDDVCGSDDLPANPSPTHPAYKFLVDCSTQGGDKGTVDPQYRSGEYSFCRKQVQEGKRSVVTLFLLSRLFNCSWGEEEHHPSLWIGKGRPGLLFHCKPSNQDISLSMFWGWL